MDLYKRLINGVKNNILGSCRSVNTDADTVLRAIKQKIEDEVEATIQRMDETMQFDRLLDEISNTYYNQLAPKCVDLVSRGEGATETEYMDLRATVLALIHKVEELTVERYAELEANKQRLVNEAGDMLRMMHVIELDSQTKKLEQIAKRYRLLASECRQFISEPPNEQGAFGSKHKELIEALSEAVRKCERLGTYGIEETTKRKKELAITALRMLTDVNRAFRQGVSSSDNQAEPTT